MKTIAYENGSFVGEVEQKEVDNLEFFLRDYGIKSFAVDKDFLQHQKNFHGGVPIDKYFNTDSGTWYIDRFFNFLSTSEKPMIDLRININRVRMLPRIAHLVPFAGLPNGDVVCFDPSKGEPHSVVIYHLEYEPMIEPVSDSFCSFLDLLSNDKN